MTIQCPVVTPDIQKLTDKISEAYPLQSQVAQFNARMCAMWIGAYNYAHKKPIDFVPQMKPLISYIEKHRNMDNKSFLYITKEDLEKIATSIIPISSMSFYSGGATGSDTFWGQTIEAAGGKVKHFTPQDYDALSQEEKDKIEREYQEVVKAIGRKSLDANSYSGKLVRRDMMQADNAETVIAIGSYDPKTSIVNGGTAYAVTRAILDGKTVYLFNQDNNTWNTYDTQAGIWEITKAPVLSDATAVIGTRGITDAGKAAIQKVVKQSSVLSEQANKISDQASENAEQASIGPETKINIYAGTGENADLSNFAERPFTFSGFSFNTVEQAFQTYKLQQLGIQLQWDGTKPSLNAAAKVAALLEELKNAKTGAEARRIGRTKITSRSKDTQRTIDDFFKDGGFWDRKNIGPMKTFIKTSFEQNPQALQRLLATGNATLTHTQGDGKWNTEFPRILMEVRDELRQLTASSESIVRTNESNDTINPEESRLSEEEKNEIEQIITVAPYFRSHLTSNNKEQLEKETRKARENAQKLASAMGLQIEAVEVVGGTYQGSSEITYQYKIKSSDQELVDLFAALMGDLSMEYQDAVIAANYTHDKSQITAYELTWKTPENTTIENVEELLKSLGIEGSTYHFNNGELDITAFSEEETQEIINKLKDTDYEFKEFNGQNSRYLDNEYRRNAYQSWLQSERGKQNRKLNNACQKALAICEAAAQYPDVENPVNNPEEQKAQENKRIAAAKKAAEEWKVSAVQPNPIFEKFKQDVESLSGYYEGGGRALKYDLPSIPDDLFTKLGNHFMGDEELSIDDYRRLWKLVEFYQGTDGLTNFRAKTPNTVSSPSKAAQPNIVSNTKFFNNTKEAAEIQRPKSPSYESAITIQDDNRVAQFNRTFSPQQVKDRGAWICSMFCTILDGAWESAVEKCQEDISNSTSEEEKSRLKQELNKLKDPVNGRQYVAQQMGIGTIIEEIKDTIKSDMEYVPEEYAQKYQNTLDFFEELFNKQAALDISDREGIRISDLRIAPATVEEDDIEGQATGDDDTGNAVSGNDGWNFQVRYEDPWNTLSKKVKSMLYEVERPEEDKDDIGKTHKYPMGQIYASLLSYLSQNMTSPDDFLQVIKDYNALPEAVKEGHPNMSADNFAEWYPEGYPIFPVLEKAQSKYPWVDQIIEKLTSDYSPMLSSSHYPYTGGAMASQFYTNFRKPYIPYGKVQTSEKNFGVTPLNYEMEDRAQYNKLVTNYNNRMVLTDTSAYNAEGKLNKNNITKLKNRIATALADLEKGGYSEYEDKGAKEYVAFVDNARNILQSFGIDATTEGVISYMTTDNGEVLMGMLQDLSQIADVLLKTDDNKENYDYILNTRDSSNRDLWKHFFDGRGLITDMTYMQSFYDSASHKTKYSYSADNYLMKMFRGITMGTLSERRAFIDEHFGKYEWFKNQKTGEWRNSWLDFWYNKDENLGDDVKETQLPYVNIDTVSERDQYGRIKVRPYIDWTKDDIWYVQDRSYAPDKERDKTAFYLAPIFSDSPMSMTVRGPKMDMSELLYGYTDSKGNDHQGAFVRLINQEMRRIKHVQERAKAIAEGKIKPVANYDAAAGGQGLKFQFMPELNDYKFPDGEKFLDKMNRLTNAKQIEAAQIQAIKEIMTAKMNAYMHDNSSHYEKSPISEQQYYNMAYANAAIIQLLTVDLAFYKDPDDFQKRFKEVYSGGINLNTNSKYGRKTENVILLKDDIITSRTYDKIAAIIDGNDNLTNKEKEDIKALYRDINVADAQALRSMHSFRAVLDMMGNWDERMEQALNNFKAGTWSKEDFDILYQTIKPFAYSVIERQDGLGGSFLVPQQHKNSEICALMMYDVINNDLGHSEVYKAFSSFMEDTVGSDGVPLIDMIQFESAGKVGNQGVINISFNPDKVIDVIDNGYHTKSGRDYKLYPAETGKDTFAPNDLAHAEKNYEAIKEQLDKKLVDGEMPQEDYNEIMQSLRPNAEQIKSMLRQAALIVNPDGSTTINPEAVHTIPFDNYYQQQPTPPHHEDTESQFGSQARNIVPADLPEDFELTLEGKNREKKTISGRDAVIDFYYELLNENLIEDFFGKGAKKGLKDIFSSKESFREAVKELADGNPKYGNDFADALEIDKSTGDFVLSPNSPTMFNLMQELVTSFFKNRITKQTINGAALIQAAGIGLDDKLRLVYDDNGNLAGAQCYMPLTSKRFFEPLLETQVINGKEIQVLNPDKLKKADLDKAIGYRFPTENKSSMMPLIIMGFTPLQNGSAIVLPADITTIAGSDFDVDKMYLMLSSFYIQQYDMEKARRAYARENAAYNALFSMFTSSQLAEDLLESEPEDFKIWFNEHKEEFPLPEPKIMMIKYDFNKSPKENGRRARNNMIIQMMYNILTSKAGSESVLNPQGFPDAEYAAKVIRIISDPVLIRKWNDMDWEEDPIKVLLDSPAKALDKFIKDNSTPESPLYPQTFAHSHDKNMAGKKQIGIYAVQASMAAKYQRADVRLKRNHKFKINGKEIERIDVSEGGRRLKNVGQMVGASADNGKKPNLTAMGSTDDTAPIIGYLLRAGLTHLEATLIINQPCMKQAGYTTDKDKWGGNPMTSPTTEVTTDMLIKGIMNPGELTPAEDKAIKGVCYRVLLQNEGMKYITNVSRADSSNGALKNTYAKARIQQYKVDLLQARMSQDNFPFERVRETLSNEAVDITASEDVVREQLKDQRMALLHGMYALGIKSFSSLISPYFFGARKNFDEVIVKPILYGLNPSIYDTQREEVVKNIYNTYITYMLSGSPLFGDEEGASMKSKRDYYLKKYPEEFRKILSEDEDVRELLGHILKVEKGRIVLQDVGSLMKNQKQAAQRRFNDLFYRSEKTRKVATDLFIYSYFDNGLNFTHDSFSTLFSTSFLTKLHDYTDTLRGLDVDLAPEQNENFIKQFLLTYPDVAFDVKGIVHPEDVTDNGDAITIDLADNKVREKMTNVIMSPNPHANGINVYPYIKYNDDIYILDKDAWEAEKSRAVYNRVEKYATFPKLPLFNINMSVTQMAQEFPYSEQSKSETEDRPTMDQLDDAPYAHNESDEDPFVDNTDADSVVENFQGLPDDITPEPPVSTSEQYTEEGKSSLQDPLC